MRAGRRQSAGTGRPFLLVAALLPLSWLYGAVAAARNLFYDRKVFRIEHVGVPVISVGNITAGGTGKTPVVEYLARMLCRMGKRPAIISRGYGRLSRGQQVVSDGETILAAAGAAGDEPYQMANKLRGVPVLVDEDRARGARRAISAFHADVILLDDGFQHRRLHRDCDIVLIDSTVGLTTMPMLPAGMRREPLRQALRRADLVAFTRVPVAAADAIPLQAEARSVRDDLAGSLPPGGATATIGFQPAGCLRVGSMEPAGLEEIAGKRCLAFCAIGNPASFLATLEALGLAIAGSVSYPDHHRYRRQDFRELAARLEDIRGDILVTTEKDAYRLLSSPLPGFFPSKICYAVGIEARLTRQGEETLRKLLESRVMRAA